MQIQQALVPSVLLELLPKSTIDIFVTIIENDGTEGCIAAGSVAASVALADAGIEMLGLVASCSAVSSAVQPYKETLLTKAQAVVGQELWLDPTNEEGQAASGSLVLAAMPALGTVTSVWQTGSMSPAEAIQVSALSELGDVH